MLSNKLDFKNLTESLHFTKLKDSHSFSNCLTFSKSLRFVYLLDFKVFRFHQKRSILFFTYKDLSILSNVTIFSAPLCFKKFLLRSLFGNSSGFPTEITLAKLSRNNIHFSMFYLCLCTTWLTLGQFWAIVKRTSSFTLWYSLHFSMRHSTQRSPETLHQIWVLKPSQAPDGVWNRDVLILR